MSLKRDLEGDLEQLHAGQVGGVRKMVIITYDVQDIAAPLGGSGKGSVGRELAQGASSAKGARNGEEFRGHCWRGEGCVRIEGTGTE